jgi:hypothetical protein
MESTVSIRKQLHQYIDVAGNEQLKAIYTLLKRELEEVHAGGTDHLPGLSRLFSAGAPSRPARDSEPEMVY